MGNRNNRSHGRSNTPEYRAWKNILYRCTDPNHIHYRNYGGRGITIYEGWTQDPAPFLDYIGPRPSPQHSVGRIDNNKGYEPGNVRWETKLEQAINKRFRYSPETQGVSKYPSVGAWSAISPSHPKTKKFVWIGRKFQTQEEAVKAREQWMSENWPDYPYGEPITEW